MNKSILKNMYFVNIGERTGQFWVILGVQEDKKIYSVLGLPESEPLYISENDLTKGIEKKILTLVEELPSEVIKDCENEFNYRINSK